MLMCNVLCVVVVRMYLTAVATQSSRTSYIVGIQSLFQLPRLDQTDRQRAYNMQRVLEGVAGVSVIPETRESKFKTASRSRLRSPNMTRRYCDMPSDAVNSVTASGCNSCTFGKCCTVLTGRCRHHTFLVIYTYIYVIEETRSVRKSTRQCLSKAVSYKEESLNRYVYLWYMNVLQC